MGGLVTHDSNNSTLLPSFTYHSKQPTFSGTDLARRTFGSTRFDYPFVMRLSHTGSHWFSYVYARMGFMGIQYLFKQVWRGGGTWSTRFQRACMGRLWVSGPRACCSRMHDGLWLDVSRYSYGMCTSLWRGVLYGLSSV